MPDLPNTNKPVFKCFPQAKEDIHAQICPTCNKPVGKFTDILSEKEYSISGMCQKCQDSIFG